jgi:signal peptidase complex subunit 1
MSDLLNTVRPYIEGPISFQAQKRMRDLSLLMLNVGGLVSFLIGFLAQDVSYTAYSFGVAVLLTLLVVVPPWPMNKGEELKWFEPKVADFLKN